MAKKEEVVEKKVDLQKELMKQFKSKFPENPLEVMADSTLAEIPGYITTGNYALNWIISKDMYKGLPMGRTILFSGDAGSGKSLIALSMMREPSIDVIVYFDSEGGGISNDFAEFIGIDSSKILYNPIDTIEELIEKMKLIIDLLEKNKTSKNVLMVIDSISMITTDREKDPSGGCYTPETLISKICEDNNIEKIKIEDIKEGDKVLTHLGVYKEVEKIHTFSKDDKSELIEIESVEGDIIKLTPTHRLLIERNKEYIWIEAEKITLTDNLVQIA